MLQLRLWNKIQKGCECSHRIFSLSKLVQEHSPRGRERSFDEVDELVICLLNVTIVIKKQFQKWCECSRTIFSLIKLVQKHSPRGREGSYDEVHDLVLCLLNVIIVIMKQNPEMIQVFMKDLFIGQSFVLSSEAAILFIDLLISSHTSR